MVSLDIDLQTWSLILFFIQAVFFTTITLVVLGAQENKSLYTVIVIFFMLNQAAFFTYGIQTGQVGFVFIVLFQIALIVITQLQVNFVKKEDDTYENF